MRAPAVGGRCGAHPASDVRRQKTDPRDAEHILELLLGGRFPRIWVPSTEERNLRQLLVHRMKMVRTRKAVRGDPDLYRTYQPLKFRRPSGVAKVAITRRLAVRLYWMLRAQIDEAQRVRTSGSPSGAVVPSQSGSKI